MSDHLDQIRRAERLREVEDAFRITPFNVFVGVVFMLVCALGSFL